MVDAAKQFAADVKNGDADLSIDVDEFRKYLYHPDIPDIDLLIRTSGEKRISNFFLWQSAYAEFYFSEELWPDFSPEEFCIAIADYQKRKRRFGGYAK